MARRGAEDTPSTSTTSADDPIVVQTFATLDATQADAVLDLVARAADADGGEPLAEDARLALRARPPTPPTAHVLAYRAAGSAGRAVAVGYAQVRREGAGASGELLVDPAVRRRGIGTRLAEALEAAADHVAPGPLSLWSHGDAPAAAALARRRGYTRARELWHMSRPLGEEAPPLPPVPPLDGVVLRPFRVGQDETAWLAVNARAFATHPEQGRWDAGDLAARLAESWFDPAGFLLAVDAEGTLLGFHWTKRDAEPKTSEPKASTPTTSTHGEVYVVGVDPTAQGRGLGPLLTLAGLHHLASTGVRDVELYVDSDNVRAQRTYARLGFHRDAMDVQYRRD